MKRLLTVEDKDELIEEFKYNLGVAYANLEGLDLLDVMNKSDVTALRKMISKIESCYVSAIPKGIAVPGGNLYTTATNDGEGTPIKVVNITYSNKKGSQLQYKFRTMFTQDNIETEITNWFEGIFMNLVEKQIACSNASVVNEVLKAATDAAGVPYTVSVSVDVMGGGKLMWIDNDSIVFAVDDHMIFDLDDIPVLRDPADENVSAARVSKSIQKLAAEFEQMQTTAKVLQKHGGSLCIYVCGLVRSTRPKTYLKGLNFPNILTQKKDGIGYYSKDNVFALVQKGEDGATVVLDPFSTEDFSNVDLDVLSEIA